MSRRRSKRTSGLNLLFALNKPSGMVTRSVDNAVGNALMDDGVGHLGTLDPSVTGVLVLAVGQGRKLISCIEEGKRKGYMGSIAFGEERATDDAEGDVTHTADIPSELYDYAFAEKAVAALVGRRMQRPPRYSAVKVGGVRAYELARGGEEFELPEREIEIYDARLVGIDTERGLRWLCSFEVSTGTYIRAIARDLGRALGCAAYLSDLCRTSSGNVRLSDCVTLEAIERTGRQGAREAALDPVRVLGFPTYCLEERELGLATHGTPFAPRDACRYAHDGLVSLVRGNLLYGVWCLDGGLLRPKANCPMGVEGVRL